MITKKIIQKLFIFCVLSLVIFGCRKAEYAKIDDPAYLKVFNCLDQDDDINPFVVMLIDPELDAEGVPVNAGIVGDFLDHRSKWARPFPDAANSNLYQDQYPGSLKVLVAPIVNGYDLSTWAQIPSGKHRVMFCSRPYNKTPFFELDRKLRKDIYADTTVDLSSREVYTLNLLLKDVATKTKTVYLRKEEFQKSPLSDSLIYINFYNLSSRGSFEKIKETNKYAELSTLKPEVPDQSSVWLSLYKPFTEQGRPNSYMIRPIVGYTHVKPTQVHRSLEAKVAPYTSFPLFPISNGQKFVGDIQQVFTFLPPNISRDQIIPGYGTRKPENAYLEFDFGAGVNGSKLQFGTMADPRSGLVISIPSGKDQLKSFATINTIEFINGQYFLSTVQRRFDPPTY